MTLKYKSVKLKNPAKPTEPAKYYARESESGRIDLPELADNIARHSTTVSKTDIQAVLTILGEELAALLAKGHSVHLGELGYFHVTLKSKGVLEEKDVNPSLIEEAKVRFVAGSVLEKEIKNAKFEKAAEPKKEAPKPAPGA
ncbi:MAG: HU family DNA-binding protein [Candidatus Nanogingivalaceae bacterium]|nr:HU family DNA-binding protein [Candidatus Nanogingivalaceae bacterium]